MLIDFQHCVHVHRTYIVFMSVSDGALFIGGSSPFKQPNIWYIHTWIYFIFSHHWCRCVLCVLSLFCPITFSDLLSFLFLFLFQSWPSKASERKQTKATLPTSKSKQYQHHTNLLVNKSGSCRSLPSVLRLQGGVTPYSIPSNASTSPLKLCHHMSDIIHWRFNQLFHYSE